MKKALILLTIMMLFGVGCGMHRVNVSTVPWKESDVLGRSLVRVSDDRLPHYNFSSNGLVLATIGDKDCYARPVWKWRLTRKGVLVIKGSGARIVMHKIKSDGRTIDLLDNGVPDQYEYFRLKR